MATLDDAGSIPAFLTASSTVSKAEGSVSISQLSPSSFRSSPPASSTMFIRSSSLAALLGMMMSPFLWNIQETAPASAMLPPFLPKQWRISLTVRLRLSVLISSRIATPPGPYPSRENSSYVAPGNSPVPRCIARLILSAGIFSALAATMAPRRRGLESGSPPPFFAAMLISLIRRVKILPRLASSAPFLCLIVAHFEWPDMARPRIYLDWREIRLVEGITSCLIIRRRNEIIARHGAFRSPPRLIGLIINSDADEGKLRLVVRTAPYSMADCIRLLTANDTHPNMPAERCA